MGVHTETKRDLVDVTGIVRSFQMRGGDPDCFRRGLIDCDRVYCQWRRWCLGDTQEPEEGGGAT